MGSSAPPHEDHPPLKVPRQTTAAVQVAYPVNTKTHPTPPPASFVQQDTTLINSLHQPATLAPKVSTAPPQQTHPATPVPSAHTTIKRPRPPPRPARFVLRDPIKMQVAVTNANCVQLAKH